MPRSIFPRKAWKGRRLGERVAFICELRGWSLNKLGDEAGIASGPMSRLGRRTEVVAASPETLVRIADASGVSVLCLIFSRGRRGEEAAARHPGGVLDPAGDVVLQVRRRDRQRIVGLVREMYSAHQRAFDAVDQEPSAPRRSPKR